MDEDDLRKKIEEEYEIYQEKFIPIMKQFINIFDKEGVGVQLSYIMLNKMIEKYNETDPTLKVSHNIAVELSQLKRGHRVNTEGIMNIDMDTKPKKDYKGIAREMNKQWLKGHKPGIILCSLKKVSECTKTKCYECKKVCYYNIGDNTDMVKKNPKKVCPKCVLGKMKYRKNINSEQLNLLEKVYPELFK